MAYLRIFNYLQSMRHYLSVIHNVTGSSFGLNGYSAKVSECASHSKTIQLTQLKM